MIDLVEERTKETALHPLGKLPEGSTGSIQAVAMDRWPAYLGAVAQALPEAAIVFDKLLSLRSTLRAASAGCLPAVGSMSSNTSTRRQIKSVVRNTGNSAPPATTP
jgi:hypothetical protein